MNEEEVATLRCIVCNKTLPLEMYLPDKRCLHGRTRLCHGCHKLRQHLYRARNPERTREINRLWEQRNKSKRIIYHNAWIEKNKTYKYEYNKKWRIDNPEKLRLQRTKEMERIKERGYPYNKDTQKYLWKVAKARAKKKNLVFCIEPTDIIIPKYCPILGIEIKRNSKITKPDSITVDRIIPELGYIKGNIQVISLKANRMKNDASSTELLLFSKWINMTFDAKNKKEIAA